jgi:hypothetical protein
LVFQWAPPCPLPISSPPFIDVDPCNLIVAFILQHPAAIRSGLIEAKIDALNRSITVTRTSKAPFSLEQWKDLRDRLQEWKDNIGGVKTVLEEVNVKMRAQQQEEAQVSAGRSPCLGNGCDSELPVSKLFFLPFLSFLSFPTAEKEPRGPLWPWPLRCGLAIVMGGGRLAAEI